MLAHYKKRLRSLGVGILFVVCCFWWLPFSLSGGDDSPQNHKGPVMEKLLLHLGDSHVLHFGNVTIGLPAIVYKKGAGWFCFSTAHLQDKEHHPQSYEGMILKGGKIVAEAEGTEVYDFSITKNVLGILLSVVLMLLLFIGLSRYMRKNGRRTPKGLWTLPFRLVRFVRTEIAKKYIGEKHYARFTPYLLTLFFFILFNNLLGLLPEGANVTGNLSVAMMLGIFTFLLTAWNGSKHYWRHIFTPPDVPVFMYPIIVPIELLGMVIRPAMLTIRLCANILAGHLVLLSIIGLPLSIDSMVMAIAVGSLVSIPVGVAMIGLKISVSFIQAYVFTLLSAIAFGSAVAEH